MQVQLQFVTQIRRVLSKYMRRFSPIRILYNSSVEYHHTFYPPLRPLLIPLMKYHSTHSYSQLSTGYTIIDFLRYTLAKSHRSLLIKTIEPKLTFYTINHPPSSPLSFHKHCLCRFISPTPSLLKLDTTTLNIIIINHIPIPFLTASDAPGDPVEHLLRLPLLPGVGNAQNDTNSSSASTSDCSPIRPSSAS